MDTGLWVDVACVALDRGVPVLDSFAGAVERPLDSDLLRDLAGGHCRGLQKWNEVLPAMTSVMLVHKTMQEALSKAQTQILRNGLADLKAQNAAKR